MLKNGLRMLSEVSSKRKAQMDFIVHFWNSYRVDDDPGATTREVLEHIECQITECLYSDPPNIDLAERLTAQAMLMMNGQML